MYRNFVWIAAICAVFSIFLIGCGEKPVWTNVTDEQSEGGTTTSEDTGENVTDTGINEDTNTNIKTEIQTGMQTEAQADMQTGIGEETEHGNEASDNIVIYICGAVVTPGVYELPAEARVIQAIEAAGGLLEDADPYLVNQAKLLQDGEQIRILTREEAEQREVTDPTAGTAVGNGDSEKEEKVNINTADVDTLMTLPGIGQAKADAIVEYRKNSGGFQKIEDIMKIAGIKEAVFAKIKDKITVS